MISTEMVVDRQSFPHRRNWVLLGTVITLLFGVLIRTIALQSDHYLRLDWSAGLLTDEGFYTHNAKNAVLFGNPRTDEFNNMLLSPLLHSAQVVVFRIFGVGAISARSISIVCGLTTVCFLWAALINVTSKRVAFTAAGFLLLDHPFALFNRMALMDTPAAFGAVIAYWAFTRANLAGRFASFWYLLSGVAMAATVTNRMLAIFLMGGPIAVMLLRERRYRVDIWRPNWWGIGLICGALAYVVLWYLPNGADISHMNRYYRVNQVQPNSVGRWLINLQHGIFGDFRGLSPYMFRHTPVLFGLSIAGVVMAWFRRRSDNQDTTSWLYLAGWFFAGCVVLSSINYSPARYYVTLYPAMAGLGSLALWRLVELAPRLNEWKFGCRVMVAIGFAFAVFHGLLAMVHYQSPTGGTLGLIALYALPVIVCFAVLTLWNRWSRILMPRQIHCAGALVIFWFGINTGWLVDWSKTIEYSRLRMEQQIAKLSSSGSVIIGDVAPGLTLNLPLRAIHVQPGLCNDDHPLEKLDTEHSLVVMLDGRFREKYWLDHYPEVVNPNRRILFQQVMRWEVGAYQVKGEK